MRKVALVLAVAALAGACRAKDNANDTGAVGDTGAAAAGAVGTPSATGGVTGDTGAMSGMTHDTAAAAATGAAGTSAAGTTGTAGTGTAKNQTQSGVVDSSGKSTLGPGVKKTRPDQGEATTSKGDTLIKQTPPR